MQSTLPLLIERARHARDDHASRVRVAAQGLQQAQATLRQLEGFRADYLQRSPAARGQALHAGLLMDWQRFVSRLDEAIGLQRQEIAIRTQQHDEAQRLLAEAQRRLMAFETLAARHAAEAARRENRREQRESDEFAARALRLSTLLGTS